jgi:hypothetical protein
VNAIDARKQQEAFLRSLKWRDCSVGGLTLIAIAALGLAVWAAVVNERQGDQITRVERTPCVEAPAGEACAVMRAEVAKAEPLRGPCTSYQRVTGVRGRNCAHFFVDRAGDGVREAVSSRGGDALQTGSTGHQQPGPRGGGQQGGSRGPSAPGNSGGDSGPAPNTGGSGGEQDRSSQTSTGAGDPAPPAPPAAPPASPGPVEHASSTAQEAVEGVKETVGGVAGELQGAAGEAICGTLVAPGCVK